MDNKQHIPVRWSDSLEVAIKKTNKRIHFRQHVFLSVNNNNNNNNRISIAPYGRNFRGAVVSMLYNRQISDFGDIVKIKLNQ